LTAFLSAASDLASVVLDRLLPLRLVLAAVGLDRRLGRLQAVEAVELRVHLGEAEVQVRLLGGVGVRRLLDQALEQLDLLAADVADRALDLEDVVGADRRALRLVVGLGRRRRTRSLILTSTLTEFWRLYLVSSAPTGPARRPYAASARSDVV
jgi:hypothetical protein